MPGDVCKAGTRTLLCYYYYYYWLPSTTPLARTGDELMKCLLVQVLISTDVGEDAECHAAKLLEVLLLQFKGGIDHVSTRALFIMLLCLGLSYNSLSVCGQSHRSARFCRTNACASGLTFCSFSTTMVSPEPFPHRTRSLRCL